VRDDTLAETFGRIRSEIIRAPTREALFEGACRVAVAAGELRLAWVGWVEGPVVRPVARAGVDAGYVDEVSVALSGPLAEGPTGRAVLHADAQYCDDFATDPRMAPWRQAAAARGFVSSASLPLRRRGEVVASLNLYSGEAAFFRGRVGRLLEALADDISFSLDRLEDQAELRRAQEEARALFELAADGIFISDSRGRYLDVNTAGQRLLGYSPDELRGMTMVDLIEPENLTANPLRLDLVHTGATSLHQRRLRRKDGSVVEVEISATRLPNGTVQGIVRDLTERNRLLSELVQADRLASVGQLAAGIAHEINNPLAYVSLNLSLLLRQLGSKAPHDELVGVATEAQSGVDLVAALVRDLRMLTSGSEERAEAVEVRHVAEQALRITAHHLRQRARVVTEFADVPPVRATPRKLEQVLINLLVNAAQAIAPGALERNEVALRVRREGEWCVIEVSDTGSGIPPEVQPRLFEPFFTTRASEGTGLGLPISQGIIQGFGGQLTFETGIGRGTTFFVRLPLMRRVTSVTPPVPMKPAGHLDGLAVLVVDDEPGIRRGLARLLRGCDVAEAADGQEALARLEERTFDLVVSDVVMPKLGGVELHTELGRRVPSMARRVVFMTGAVADERMRTALDATGCPVLAKPFRLEELEAAARLVLEAGASGEPA
jgi:PAS domain S-box-containing protein